MTDSEMVETVKTANKLCCPYNSEHDEFSLLRPVHEEWACDESGEVIGNLRKIHFDDKPNIYWCDTCEVVIATGEPGIFIMKKSG